MKIWKRINVILGYPFLFMLDILISLTTEITFKELRKDSSKALKNIWQNSNSA